MTSKEALEHIIKLVSIDAYYKEKLEDDFKTIQKDLDTLQNKLAEYEALEEQGRLIKLPCAVGDKIYIVSYPYFSTDEIKKISVNYETRTELIKEYQIGTYAFFDKEEAEALFEQIKEGLENR